MSTTDIADNFTTGAWEFTPEVVAEFDRHVRQSVPFYDVIQDTVAELADWLAPAGSTVVDLGISTGETFRRINERHPERDHAFIGYDTSPDMLEAARRKVPDLTTYEADIADGLEHYDAALTLSLFTLQFLEPEVRADVLADAYERTAPGGAIIIAEKIRIPDARWSEVATELSWDYKADQGIPSDAIRTKARALRGVLRPETEWANLLNLADAGWSNPVTLFRWHQWAVFGAFE